MATNKNRKLLRKRADGWLIASLVLCLGGRIYESFGQGIMAYPMIYAFSYALFFGCALRVFLARIRLRYMPAGLAESMYNCGTVTFIIGSIIDGALQIYGTSSEYTDYYYYLAGALVVLSLILFVVGIIKKQEVDS